MLVDDDDGGDDEDDGEDDDGGDDVDDDDDGEDDDGDEDVWLGVGDVHFSLSEAMFLRCDVSKFLTMRFLGHLLKKTLTSMFLTIFETNQNIA